MKVSVITVVYNNASTITDAIQSVLSQSYNDIEYIVIDGNSKDGTQEKIKPFFDKISAYRSEPDKGLYDALNKGINLSTGDIVGFLHSDDVYEDNEVISDVVKEFERIKTDGVYGDLVYIAKDQPSKIFRKWISGKYRHGMFLNGWMPPHPALFLKKEVYDTYGLFRTDLASAADYEIMLRFIHKNRIRLQYLPRILVRMRTGGESNKNISNRVKANVYDRKAWEVNGLTPRLYTLWLKPLRKVFQFRLW